jgi:hypothetical protein
MTIKTVDDIYSYIKEVTKTDEDGFQEVVLKLFETLKNFDFNNKNYNYINYYKLMICNWYKNYKNDNNKIISRGYKNKANQILKKESNTKSELDFLNKFNSVKNIKSLNSDEYGKECCDMEYEIINNLESNEQLRSEITGILYENNK